MNVHHALNHLVDGALVRHVHGMDACLTAEGLDPLLGFAAGLLVQIDEGDVRPRGSETFTDGEPDPAGRTGHHGNLAGEIE